MFGLFRQLSGHADEAETLMLRGDDRASMLGSYGGAMLRLKPLSSAMANRLSLQSGKFSMTPLQVLTSKIRSSQEETVFMASTTTSYVQVHEARRHA